MLLGWGTDAGSLRRVREVAEPSDRPGDMDRAEWFARWQALHGGIDPSGSRWLRGWLTLIHHLARPLARRHVRPDLLTTLTLVPTLAVVGAAAAGGRWPLAGAVLIVLSGVGDSLDGAVAVMTDRTTALGYVLDSVVDRVNDVLYVVALSLLGAPVELAAVAGVAILLLEYLRARAANAGGGEVGVVTVAERPTRVLVPGFALLAAGAVPGHAGVAATAGAAVLGLLVLIGFCQLAAAVRTSLAP